MAQTKQRNRMTLPEKSKQLAKEAGAVKYKAFYTFKNRNKPNSKEPFTIHFFNEAGLEVGYYLHDFKHTQPFTTLPNPREWSDWALGNKVDYSEFIPLENDNV